MHDSSIARLVVVFVLCSEILRVIDSLQLAACKKVATPANWKVLYLSPLHVN